MEFERILILIPFRSWKRDGNFHAMCHHGQASVTWTRVTHARQSFISSNLLQGFLMAGSIS